VIECRMRILLTMLVGHRIMVQLPDQCTRNDFLRAIEPHRVPLGFKFLVRGKQLYLCCDAQFNLGMHCLRDNDTVICVERMNGGGAAEITLTERGAVFYPYCFPVANSDRPPIIVHTAHISCRSDMHRSGVNKAGFIMYSYNDQFDFYLNGNHCKSGYILIKETDNSKLFIYYGA
jgi:hypothetical protein